MAPVTKSPTQNEKVVQTAAVRFDQGHVFAKLYISGFDLLVQKLCSYTCKTLRKFSTAIRIAFQICSKWADTQLRVSIRSSRETLCIEAKMNGLVR